MPGIVATACVMDEIGGGRSGGGGGGDIGGTNGGGGGIAGGNGGALPCVLHAHAWHVGHACPQSTLPGLQKPQAPSHEYAHPAVLGKPLRLEDRKKPQGAEVSMMNVPWSGMSFAPPTAISGWISPTVIGST